MSRDLGSLLTNTVLDGLKNEGVVVDGISESESTGVCVCNASGGSLNIHLGTPIIPSML